MVKALNMGADDYIVKPVTADVLTTRIRTLLSRSSHLNTKRKSDQSSIVKCDHLTIDCNKREVKIDGDRIELNPTEFRLLSVLARHQGRTLPYEYLLTKVWGREYIGEKEYLRLYIGYLRRKLERDPSKPSLIHSVWRIGYRLGPCHKSDPEYLLMVA
jgi:two-component system KDP operon response regulator KdpE